jgi:hypothetical protein
MRITAPITALLAACVALLSTFAHAQTGSAKSPATVTYKGAYFEIQYPADFKAQPLNASKPSESSAATFTSPDGAMTFYVFSPQWGGDAPGIALDAAKETEISRKNEKGKSSGVEGTFTWTTIAAKDKSYTRTYQDFLANDKSIHWVIGMKFTSDAVLQKHKAAYAAFKGSLKQLAD